MRALALALALAAALAPGARAADEAGDLRARYRELGVAYTADPAEARAEALFALVDAEIAESLASGAPFASPEFIGERLDGLAAAWGGMSHRIAPAGAPGSLAAALDLAGSPPLGSLRFYGPGPKGPALRASITRPGRLTVKPWPTPPGGGARVAATWVGAGAPGAGYPVWLEVWEMRADRGAAPVWRSEAAFPDGLVATGFAVESGRIAVRYPAPYAGFKPGCTEQTEQVEVFRAGAPGARIARQSVHVENPWHREVAAAADRLFGALESGDRRTLAGLVPDARLRARLPAHLRPEAACDQREDGGRAALVAATEERAGTLRPWALRFVRAGAGWRLAAASPVLE